MNSIKINDVEFDPQQTGAMQTAAAPPAKDATASDYILIQVKQPLTTDQRRALQTISVEILDYVSENTYLVRYTPSDLGAIRNLPFVEWADVYHRAFKIKPSLAIGAPVGHTRSLVELAAVPTPPMSQKSVKVDVVLHKGIDAGQIRDKLAAVVGLNAEDIKAGSQKIRLTVPEKSLQAIAALDDVNHIEPAPEYELSNNIARGIMGLPSPDGAAGLAGENQVVAIADTGFDMGVTNDVHPAFTGRVNKLYSLGRPGQANDPKGHGTHVAGSVLGDGTSDPLGLRIAGTAPAAKLVVQSVLDSDGNLGGLPDDLHDLFLPTYRDDGARVHTNSWNARKSGGVYNSNCQEIDDFVWNNRDFVICFSAGNDGADSQRVGRIDPGSCAPPGTAKNCITVGSTENNRAGFGNGLTYGTGWPNTYAEPIASDQVADNPEGMAAFSGRGPVQSGRIKPDVAAPGTAILSARSRATSDNAWGATADPLYFFDGGTSMSTPLVAGCAAVVREFLTTTKGLAKPSAALIKALLVNGAQPIKGQYTPPEVGAVPDPSEGFGRVNISTTLGPLDPATLFQFKDEATELDTGAQEQLTITVGDRHTLFRATLVWTDPAGPTLQNDLDLIVRSETGEERHGNIPAGSAEFDRLNNIEQVLWILPPAGIMTITVRAFHVTVTPQSYAIVVKAS